MVHTRPPRSHHWHLSLCPTLAQRLLTRCSRNRCQVDESAFALASLCKLLASYVLLQGSKDVVISGPHNANRTIHPTVLTSHPVNSVSLHHLRSSWLQTLETYFFYDGMHAFVPPWDRCLIKVTHNFTLTPVDLLRSNFIEIRLTGSELEHLNFRINTVPFITSRPNTYKK